MQAARDTVLVVDDMQINREVLREILSDDYDIVEASGGQEALEHLIDVPNPPTAVLLDIMMPDMDGFEVLAEMKKNQATERIPVLFITAADAGVYETLGLEKGAVDYITKPFNIDVVKARVDNHIQLHRYRTSLEEMVERKTADLMRVHEQMLETMASIIEYRSLESGTHIRRTSQLTHLLITRMLTAPRFRQPLIDMNYAAIVKAVPMHDIGKVGIPDAILLKPGKLTPEEFEIMKTHSMIGYDIIKTISTNLTEDSIFLTHCANICRYHHERWDGSGYPDRLAGEAIPLSARILSVVDVYDALVAERCYKPAMPHEKAVEILRNGAGTQFDPYIIEVFLGMEAEFRQCAEQCP